MENRRITPNHSLPEEIIQHIQSFMSGNEAAQTSILSKSWHRAWLTRPDLDFDQRDFRILRFRNGNGFWGFAKKTLQRYEQLNLKIDSFRLFTMECDNYSDINRTNSLTEDLTAKSMKLGVVDIDFGVGLQPRNSWRSSTLPRIVLEYETLIRLSLSGIELNLGQNRKVSWSKLRSLSLHWVSFRYDDTIWAIISCCPLIENLTLSKCFRIPDKLIRLGANSSCNLSSLHNLKSLFLFEVNVDPLFFSKVLSNFACLKVLSLHNCGGYNYKGIKLSSRSLECVTFKQKRLLRVNFDIPSICKFEYLGLDWPSVSFTTPSRNWESHLDVGCQHRSTKWFLKLHELLTCLSLSKIYLSIKIQSVVEKQPASFQGLTKTAVESLTMYESPCFRSPVMECLFLVCRPKLITLYMHPFFFDLSQWKRGALKTDFLKILWNRTLQGVRENCLMENENMYGLHDLEQVNVEIFEKSVSERQRPLTCRQTLFGVSCTKVFPKIWFQLRWAVDPVSLQ